MVQSIPLGPIVLTANGQFNSNGGLYSANTSYVDIALKPSGSEPLHELIRVDLTKGGLLTFNTQDPTRFDLAGGSLSVEVDGNTSPAPIWQAPDSTTEVPFDLSRLVDGSGVALDEKNALPITVSRVAFSIDNLLLHQPQGLDSSASQVLMQGGVTLPAFQNWDLSRFMVRVDGPNYVIVDHSGTTLTGVRAGGPSEAFRVAGIDVQGTFNLEYSHTATDTIFSIAFGVAVSTQPRGTPAPRSSTASAPASRRRSTTASSPRSGSGSRGSSAWPASPYRPTRATRSRSITTSPSSSGRSAAA